MSRRPNPKPIPYTARDGTRTWRIRYRIDGHNTTETFDTKREAQEFAADIRDFGALEAVRRLTERDTPTSRGPSLDDVFAEFIEWNAGRVKSSRTGEEYAAQWRAIAPAIGSHRPVDTITEDDVQRWVDAMTSGKVGARIVKGKLTPLSPKTIANRHGLLHSVFKFAAARGQRYITTNPCAETELPKRRKGMPKGLRGGEWQALHAALTQIDPDAADLAWALYASGARFGEITALQTWSVEDDGRHVTLIIDHVNRRLEGGRYEIVEDTKSDAGFRRVRLGAGASAMIRRRVLDAGPGGLVFTNRHGRIWLHSTAYLSWNRAVELANLSRRPTIHWLRHSHVQALLDRGEQLQQIQARVGHEHYGTTVGTYGSSQRGVSLDVLDDLDPVVDAPQISATIVAGQVVATDSAGLDNG
jgi:site-specific recombinase XerD